MYDIHNYILSFLLAFSHSFSFIFSFFLSDLGWVGWMGEMWWWVMRACVHGRIAN